MSSDRFMLDLYTNPYPWYAAMREQSPVLYDQQRHIWNVFCYADVKRVLSDPAIFSSESPLRNRSAGAQNVFAVSMINSDPPLHRSLRALVSQAFTPRMVQNLAPRIAALIAEMLDALTDQPSFDCIDALAYPLPVMVIAEMLGIPVEDRAQFKKWSDVFVSEVNLGPRVPNPEMQQANRELGAYFASIIAQRRKEPRNDLISALLEAEINGQYLTQQELLGFCALLLVAGNETTTNLLGNLIVTFDEHPEVWDALHAEPALVDSAIEEVLRYRSPVKAMFRFTREDVELQGQLIPSNSMVLAWIGSANRDETVFPQAQQFDPRRAGNQHIAFGYGIHYCLGAPLARLETKLVLEALLQRYHSVRCHPTLPAEPVQSPITFGLSKLPVQVRPL